MIELPLFAHADRAAQLRDAGMRLAASAQDGKHPGWSELAYAAIVAVAKRQEHLFVDDVLRELRADPHHPNAWGGVWMRAIRSRVIEDSGHTKRSADPKKHAHKYTVYRSLVLQHA